MPYSKSSVLFSIYIGFTYAPMIKFIAGQFEYMYLLNYCNRYTKRIHSDPINALHDHIHTGGRISSRSGRFIPALTQTALGSKNLFRHY